MITITIKINERTKAGKAFIAMSESFLAGVNGIEIIESKSSNKDDQDPYDQVLVKKVLKAAKSKNRTRVEAENL
jgi:hypothetical protein